MKPLRRRSVLASLAVAPLAWAQEDHTGGDPLGSMQYPSLREQTIGKVPARFTDAVLVKGSNSVGLGRLVAHFAGAV